MPHDAIIGARYMDTVFDSEFTIVEVRAETDEDIASEDEVIVVLDYDETFEDPIERPLSEFRRETGINVVSVPDHAG